MRKKIIDYLKTHGKGISKKQLERKLNISPREKSKLRKILREMIRDGIIKSSRNRFMLPEKEAVIRGKYFANPNGYGFVSPENQKGEDVFIPPGKTKDALNGDLVEIIYKERIKGKKREGSVVRIIKRGRKKIVGYYEKKLNRNLLIPIDPKNSKEIILDKITPFNPLPGMIVEAELIEGLRARVVDVFGYPDEPGVDIRVISREYDLKEKFPIKILEEAKKIPLSLKRSDFEGRIDLRKKLIITIDGENAKDFDDAVSIEKLKNGNFLLGVHIADVSHFVKTNTKIDEEAFQRGNSVYFPEEVFPMLPERLSNNICSLNPGEERLTVSVLMEIDREGNLVRNRVSLSVIKSSARMTYTSVYKILNDDKEEKKKYPQSLINTLFTMRELSEILRSKRIKQGSLDFDIAEPELIYEGRSLSSIGRFEQNEAHQIIEEFMLCANETVAKFLVEKGYPLIFRIHDRPDNLKLQKLKKLLSRFGLIQNGKKPITSFELQRVINKVHGKPEEKFISLQILKSLPLAHYSSENIGHYALAKEYYTHFTSPIRRYPDLIVHRILKNAIQGGKDIDLNLEKIAEHCSQTERNADDAERNLIEWRIIRFLRSKLGEEFTGTVVDISKEGLIIELDEYFVEGTLHFNDLRDDYYYRKSPNLARGRKKGRTYRLGDRLRVILAMVDQYRRRVFFTLA